MDLASLFGMLMRQQLLPLLVVCLLYKYVQWRRSIWTYVAILRSTATCMNSFKLMNFVRLTFGSQIIKYTDSISVSSRNS
jgi:hypothetical protein